MVKKSVRITRVKRESTSNIAPLLISAAAGALIGVIVAANRSKQKPRSLGFTLSNTYNKLSDQAEQLANRKSSSKKMLWLGAIAGGVIGLTAITLLSDSKGKKGHGLVNGLKDAGHAAVEGFQSINWSDLVENVADSVVDKLQEGEEDEDEEEELEEGPSNKIQSIVDWAILGLNVWQNIKKGR